jgi:hypothetical protein
MGRRSDLPVEQIDGGDFGEPQQVMGFASTLPIRRASHVYNIEQTTPVLTDWIDAITANHQGPRYGDREFCAPVI